MSLSSLVPYMWPIYAVGAFIITLRGVLFWVYYLQTKQYRLDTIRIDIKNGKFWRLVFSKSRIIAFILLITIIVAKNLAFSTFILSTYFIGLGLVTIKDAFRRKLKTPKVTTKSVIIVLLSLLLLAAQLIPLSVFAYWFSYYNGNLDPAWVLLTIELTLPLVVLCLFSILYIPNRLSQLRTIKKAYLLRKRLKSLKVIGITGSYGKTSTKEFLAHLLSSKYKVLKTPKHINVDTGIAEFMLENLDDSYDYFVVEMGAYRMGEIARICQMTLPDYAVMTYLDNQHLELFGSIKKIEQAKFELVDFVSNPGSIFANCDSAKLKQAFEDRKMEPHWYGSREESHVKIGDIKSTLAEEGNPITSFSIKDQTFSAPLFDQASLNNLHGALTFCDHLGIPISDLAKSVRTITQIKQTMEIKSDDHGTLIIDDSYNAGTEAILLAIDSLANINRTNKVFIFDQVLERGGQTNADHERIAKRLAKKVSHIMILPSDRRDLLISKVLEVNEHIVVIKEVKELRELLSNDTVILFEGRASQKILKLL